ncbi:MAG: winged helix-turn-helix transcriptional regulator [Akkermansia sp.]|nr:winged helix-turn-helix transcriptional regulator [Akkermansia sp.]
MSEPDNEFFARWMMLWKNIDGVFNAELHRAGISYSEYLLLESLQGAPQGMEPSALADARGMSRQHVNLLLRQLENAELITRTGATVDKRRRIIALSPLGAEKLSSVKNNWLQMDSAGWAGFAPYERGRILSLLEHYLDNLKS